MLLLQRPGELYESASDDQRRALNQALFAQLLVDAEEIVDAVFNEPFAELVVAENAFRLSDGLTGEARLEQAIQIASDEIASWPENKKTTLTGGLLIQRVELLLQSILCVRGSSSEHMVDPRGFEPLTPCMPCRCATGLRHGPRIIFKPRRQLVQITTDRER